LEKTVLVVGQQLRKWFADPGESLFIQVPRALLASMLAAVVDCAVLFFLVNMTAWERVPAAVVAYLAGAIVQYFLCSWWVFPGAPQSAAAGFMAFLVLSLFGLVITWMTMAVLANVHLCVAKVVALGLAFSWNFLSRKYLLFSEGSR
jgi:putative flippase GtrA